MNNIENIFNQIHALSFTKLIVDECVIVAAEHIYSSFEKKSDLSRPIFFSLKKSFILFTLIIAYL